MFYTYTSFNYPPTIFRYDVATKTSSVFRETTIPGFKADDYEVKQVFFPSKDGTKVPMYLVHKKGLALDGRNPALMYGYGGFNITTGPSFSALRIALLEQGFVYASVNLRGGSEYGETWHEAGMKLKKQNVFDDFIGAAEWLIANKYTSADRLAMNGGSNGGLLVGAVLNQRPDLFKAAVPQVGVMDMLRFHKFTIGWNWIADYGSSDDAAEFKAIYAYSPLHNIKAQKYPATLITTADHDDRVVPGTLVQVRGDAAGEAGGRRADPDPDRHDVGPRRRQHEHATRRHGRHLLVPVPEPGSDAEVLRLDVCRAAIAARLRIRRSAGRKNAARLHRPPGRTRGDPHPHATSAGLTRRSSRRCRRPAPQGCLRGRDVRARPVASSAELRGTSTAPAGNTK